LRSISIEHPIQIEVDRESARSADTGQRQTELQRVRELLAGLADQMPGEVLQVVRAGVTLLVHVGEPVVHVGLEVLAGGLHAGHVLAGQRVEVARQSHELLADVLDLDVRVFTGHGDCGLGVIRVVLPGKRLLQGVAARIGVRTELEPQALVHHARRPVVSDAGLVLVHCCFCPVVERVVDGRGQEAEEQQPTFQIGNLLGLRPPGHGLECHVRAA
jgi:hypothetical protein